MPPGATQQQQDWLNSFLGMEIGRVPATAAAQPVVHEQDDAAFDGAWQKARTVWRDNVEAVDEQISKVRAAMLASGDPDLASIADRGLTALTANHKTPVMRALIEVTGSKGAQRRALAAKARAAVAAFQAHIDSDPRIRVLDEESQREFGVKLTIREGIGRGLQALAETLRPLGG